MPSSRSARSGGRRLAAGLAAAGALVVAGGLAFAPASLAGAPSVSITDPTGGQTLATATPTISGSASATSGGGTISGDLQVVVTSQAGHPGFTATRSNWCGQASCSFNVQVSPALAWNGSYTLAVQATETDPTPDTSGQRSHQITQTTSFQLAAPPAAPSSVRAQVASDGSSVALSWSANSEPDIVGYEINRSPASTGSWPAAVTGTSFVDNSVQPGTSYTYSVAAVRQGADSGSTVVSSWTNIAATTPAPPTTTTQAPSGSGQGGSAASSGSTSKGSSAGSGGQAGGSSRRSDSPQAAAEAASNLASFDALLAKTAANTPAPAQAAPQVPAIPEDGPVGAGSDNPTVAPFSQGSGGGLTPGSSSSAVRFYRTTVPSGIGSKTSLEAIALAALLVAVVAHLLWLRRQIA
ncbi:MAG TPA: fibronectin type III domain-containing protein [Acidimicrobiales bacterium]|nr:fibronectin type III domain-containing protein [Acidimicrobiales bacterium]